MDQLKAMRTLLRVVDEGSFAAAARALNMAPAGVTRLVADLEALLGTRLIHRTTRHLSLTEIGEHYVERARGILAEVEAAEAEVHSAHRDPRGVVRLRCPPAFAVHQVAQVLPGFHERYPQVTVEISATGLSDEMDDSQDITVLWSGEPLDGDFVARRLARSDVVLCASPAYLARHGVPQQPADLAGHRMLSRPMNDPYERLGLQPVTGDLPPQQPGHDEDEPARVQVHGSLTPLRSLNSDLKHASALVGLGIAALPTFIAGQALKDGTLVRVLPGWRVFSLTLWACIPTRKHVPVRTRALLDYLVSAFGGQDVDPWLAALDR